MLKQMCEMRHWLTGLAFGLKRDERLSLKSSHMLVCLKHNQGLENTDDSVRVCRRGCFDCDYRCKNVVNVCLACLCVRSAVELALEFPLVYMRDDAESRRSQTDVNVFTHISHHSSK